MKQGGFADMEDPIGRDLPSLERIEARHVEALALAEPAGIALAGTPAQEEAERVRLLDPVRTRTRTGLRGQVTRRRRRGRRVRRRHSRR